MAYCGEEEEEEEEEQGWEAGGEPGRARGSGKWETGIQGRDRGREFGTGTRDGKKGEGRSERGGWVKTGGNVVDRLSTVKVSYPRVDCNNG